MIRNVPEIRNPDFSKKNGGLLLVKGSTKKYLRSLAHHLNPVVLIGRSGVTDQLIAAIDAALNDHELIKVKFNEFKADKKEIATEIAGATKSELAGLIGNIAILYRQNPRPELRKFKLNE